jgi:hypothetical protein
MAIRINNNTVIDDSRNVNAGIGTFTALDIKPRPITFSPTDGATGISIIQNIVITYDQTISKGTGNITLRNSSGIGTVIETIDVTSGVVSISGTVLTINPVNPLPLNTDVYVVIDAGAILGLTTTSTSSLLNTYNFTTEIVPQLGDPYEGGTLICCASPVRWVAAPRSSEVSRNFYSRHDAGATAQQVSGCTGWFIPSNFQLQNPGYNCRSYWSVSSTNYWSGTEQYGCTGWAVSLTGGNIFCCWGTTSLCVRAFRCVTY